MNPKDFFDPPLEARPTQRLIDIRPKAGTASSETYRNPSIDDIQRLKELGFGGVSTQLGDEGYLDSEEGWNALQAQLSELRRLGMRAWIRDERGRPSGKAAGKAVLRYPEGRALGLLHSSLAFEGPGEAVLPVPAGRVVSLSAVFLRDGNLDLREVVGLVFGSEPVGKSPEELPLSAADGYGISVARSEGPLPEGPWILMAFVERPLLEGTFANDPTSGNEAYINIMDEKAVEAYLAVCHEKHREKVGDYFKDVVAGFHSDEPLLISSAFPSGKPFPPYPALPWRRDLPDLFHARYGYDLLPLLPTLFHDAGPDTAAVRCDFYRFIGELCGRAFTQAVGGWCRRNGIRHKLQSLGEESLVTQTAFEGSLSCFVGAADYPCADLLSATPETFRYRDQTLPAAKIVSSAAFHHGSTEVEADFGDAYQYRGGVLTSREQLRGSIGWLFATGATSLNSICVWKKRDPEDWKEITAFAGRLTLALRGTRHRADLALFSPLPSVRANYVPTTRFIMEPPIGSLERTRIWSETYASAASRWELPFRDLVWALLDRQRDFGILEDQDFAAAEFSGAALRIGAAEYRAVVLPPEDTADPETLLRIAEHVRGGGLAVAFYPLPFRSARKGGGNDARDLAREIFGEAPPHPRGYSLGPDRWSGGGGKTTLGPSGSGDPAEEGRPGKAILAADADGLFAALDDFLPPEIRLTPWAPEITVMHRYREGEDIYVFSNPSASDFAVEAKLRLGKVAASTIHIEILDPLTGAVIPALGVSQNVDVVKVPLRLPARSAMLARVFC